MTTKPRVPHHSKATVPIRCSYKDDRLHRKSRHGWIVGFTSHWGLTKAIILPDHYPEKLVEKTLREITIG